LTTTNGSEAGSTNEVQTLFLVVLDLNGQSRVVLDPEARFTAQRLATSSDVFPSLANALADYQAIKTAEAILSFQTQIAHQLARETTPSSEPEAQTEGHSA
jgi:hypothetical protein